MSTPEMPSHISWMFGRVQPKAFLEHDDLAVMIVQILAWATNLECLRIMIKFSDMQCEEFKFNLDRAPKLKSIRYLQLCCP